MPQPPHKKNRKQTQSCRQVNGIKVALTFSSKLIIKWIFFQGLCGVEGSEKKLTCLVMQKQLIVSAEFWERILLGRCETGWLDHMVKTHTTESQ